MANDIEIVNLALHRLGAGVIQSFDEATRESRVAKALYPFARNSALRDHDWQFARKQESLTLTTQTVSGWDYVYAYPPDCLAAREIYNAAKTSPLDLLEFEIGISSDKNSRIILTDVDEAELIYTALVTNATVFDPLFCEALAYKLAADMAQALRGDPSIQGNMLNFYQRSISDAKMQSSNESYTEPSMLSDFSRARQ